MELELPDGEVRLDPTYEVALFRVAQECLTNVQRHSHASSARLQLAYGARVVVLEVEDQGVGVTADLLEDWRAGNPRAASDCWG